MASNMYKVGGKYQEIYILIIFFQNLKNFSDWVYCEVSPYQPYVIRKIEELTKVSTKVNFKNYFFFLI